MPRCSASFRAPFLTLALLLVTAVAGGQTQTHSMPIDPGPLDGEIVFLTLVGPDPGGFVTNVTLNITFQTAGNFDAGDLELVLGGPVVGTADWVVVTGTDLGWSGQGTFTGTISTTSLNGELPPGLPGFPTVWDLLIWPASGSGGVHGLFIDSEYLVEYTLDPGTPTFSRGDANDGGDHDIGDVIYILDHIFSGGPLGCLDAANTNSDSSVDISDAVYLLNFLFSMGPAPEAPFPDCGTAAESIGCEVFESCP